ncbi:CPBP family intramembrane metalloprotease [Clostridium sp. D2Q-14]|uniref:CPBP family intramembrane glutamic endopeptidase n=1 Tax=Anaeromonas gelatinilytica TaxID=2683194 RepID=UPI00193BF5E6|nr:type II CAAX endopeptidase family protein [Anaeromonas gelatinilytica]MBS4535716.1 CPBP family intramembrane metalloprotease [Anaeromonas gelatinilytica]
MHKEEISTIKTILVVFLGILILVFAQGVSSLIFELQLPNGVVALIFGICYIMISYILIKVCCIKLLNIRMNECYIGKPKVHFRWLICAIILPVSVSAVLLFNPGELIKNNVSVIESINIIVGAIFTVGFGAGVVEEMVFRGLIMKLLEKRWGKLIAIIIPSVFFGILHVVGIKMNIIDILLLFIAGTSVGIMFSLIVYESGSIWSSAIVHGIWNVIMIGGILDISNSYNEKAIFSYKLSTESMILTGGVFGVEASIFAVLGYILVILWTIYLIKKKSILKGNI